MQPNQNNNRNSKINKNNNLRYPKRFCGIVGLLFVLFLLVSIKAFSTSPQIEIINDENLIVQTTNFDYQAKLIPNTLYPSGIISPSNSPLFKNITEELIIKFDANVSSTQPVTVIGTGVVNLILEGEGLWEHVIPLSDVQSFEKIGENSQLVNQSMTVNLGEIFTLIEKIDEEIGVRSSRMKFRIQPEFDGEISYYGEKLPLHIEEEFIFDYSSQQLNLISENEFEYTTPIINKEIMSQNYQFFGVGLPLSLVRWISLIGMVASLFFIIVEGKKYYNSKIIPLTEAEKIIKKHGKHFITLTERLDIKGSTIIELNAFQPFLRLAEERELPVLMLNDQGERQLIFYIIDQGIIYTFKAINHIQHYEEPDPKGTNYEVS